MAKGSVFKRCSCRNPLGRKLGTKCPQLRRPGGSYNPHHGWWAYQLELPHTPNGARRQLRRGGFDSRDTATADLDHAKALLALAGDDEVLAGQIANLLLAVKPGGRLPDRDTVARRVRAGIPASKSTTVAEYLQQWLDGRRSIEPSTQRIYATHIRLYLIPHLGHLPLEKLSVAHTEAMFAAIEARNAEIRACRESSDPQVRASVKGARTVSPATMQRIRACLRKALNDAIRRRLIEFNPAVHVELPSGTRPKARVWTVQAVARWKTTGQRPSPVMVWTPQQAGQFLDYAEAHDIYLYPMFVLILHRGLRRGEACGIRDADIDLDAGLAVISQQLTTCGYTPVTKKVKSAAGDRTISLDQNTAAALRAYRARRARWQLLAGPDWPDTGFFFVQPDGNPWHPDTVTDRFEALVAAAGLPPVRLHDLRHCAATYLKAAGGDLKTIQETLGHSSITITGDTYTSVILEMERDLADAAANLVPRQRRRAA